MTAVGITLLTAVAFVNLTLGFGVAAFLGRGPFAVRARSTHALPRENSAHPVSAGVVPTAPADTSVCENANLPAAEDINLNPAPTISREPVAIQTVESADGAEFPLPVLSEQALQTIQHFAAGIETIEQNLQTLLREIEASDEPANKLLLSQWAVTVITQANQLSDMREDFRKLAEEENLSSDLQTPALELLPALQQNMQAAVVVICQVRSTNADRSASVSCLMSACQKVRGAINVVSFF